MVFSLSIVRIVCLAWRRPTCRTQNAMVRGSKFRIAVASQSCQFLITRAQAKSLQRLTSDVISRLLACLACFRIDKTYPLQYGDWYYCTVDRPQQTHPQQADDIINALFLITVGYPRVQVFMGVYRKTCLSPTRGSNHAQVTSCHHDGGT